MQIILDQDAADWVFEHFRKWDKLGEAKFDFPNWKRSSVDRENRRESIVYGNCAEYLCWLLRNAVDENGGESWWIKLSAPNNGMQPTPESGQTEQSKSTE